MSFRIFILLLSIFYLAPCRATTYYLSSAQGDDTRNMRQARYPATPWKTINKLNAILPQLLPGDSVLFKRGEVFYGGLEVKPSGNGRSAIVFAAYGAGEPPVISGFTEASGWVPLGNGVYESAPLPVASGVRMVVINGVNYAMGRTPNPDAKNGGYLTMESCNRGSVTDRNLPGTAPWVGAELVMRSERWIIDRAIVTGQSGHTLYYHPEALAYRPNVGYGYFIQNDIRTLDQFGEWYYNPASHRLAVYFGDEPPDGQTVQASTVDILFQAHGDHIMLKDLTLSGANQYGVYSGQRRMTDFQIENCKVAFSGIDAIHIPGCDQLRIERCTVLNANNNAIFLEDGCPYARIRKNVIRSTGLQAGMGRSGDGNYFALYSSARGLKAEYNTIIRTGYSGIYFAGDSVLIRHNYIDTFCLVKDDGGGIYSYLGVLNKQTTAQSVIGNIVLNGMGAAAGTPNRDYFPAEGIYLDDEVNHVEVRGNTVANCRNNGIFLHNARDFILEENTLYNNRIQLSVWRDFPDAKVRGGVIAGNILFAGEPGQKLALLSTLENDIADFARFANNYYVRRSDQDPVVTTRVFSESFFQMSRDYSLAEWQQRYGKDQGAQVKTVYVPAYFLPGPAKSQKCEEGNPGSRAAPRGVIIPAKTDEYIRFECNVTMADRNVCLEMNYSDAKNIRYENSLALPPFASVILIRDTGRAPVRD